MQYKKNGYLCFVLHAHQPFVYHPESSYLQEESWLFEAITETYIPLLNIFEALVQSRVPLRLTLSLTPTLCAMLANQQCAEKYVNHVDKLTDLAKKEIVRTRNEPLFNKTATMYLETMQRSRHIFIQQYNGNLIKAFCDLQNKGAIEIITSAATHAYLPNMQYNPNAVRAQIEIGVQSYVNYFGKKPAGIWLPECGYFPGLETFLKEAGIHYFFVDTHGILFAKPRPKYGVFAPIHCKNSPVAAFGRDIESSKSVWSAQSGYPGDFLYRDFYRDIGFDLDYDYIKPYIDPSGERLFTGFKYYKITGQTDKKEPYNHSEALNRAFEHAGNFLYTRQKQVEYLGSIMDRTPVIVAPYDAELFGHWWFEGTHWLNYLIRKIAFEQDCIKLATPSDYLSEYPTNQVCEPSFSSWGQKGYSEVWLDSSNDWIYRHLHMIEEIMTGCARQYKHAEGLVRRTLNQMARELLLAESSDWAFIMKTGTMVEYAVRRTREHIADFLHLYNNLFTNKIDEKYITVLEARNNIFSDMDYTIYAEK